MNIEDFLNQFIDRYLLRDLDSMAAVSPPPGETGACGFSMVLVTLAGCELLGAITYPKRFVPREGGQHFEHFWRNGLYPTDAVRANLAPTVYKLVRHGLAHAFVTKPMILVTKNKTTKNHLCRDAAGVLTIDCLALADDFRAAYQRFVLPRVQAGRSALQHQLDAMQSEASDDSADEAIRIGSMPQADPNEGFVFIPSGQVMAPGPPIPSGMGNVNSPTVPPRWKNKT